MTPLAAMRFIAGLATALFAPLSLDAQTGGAQGASPSTYRRESGEVIYRTICQGCHMPDGKGATGAGTYPALASNPRLAAAAYPMVIVLKGRKAMPPFADELSDEQIAAVVNFIRRNFSNTYSDLATSSDVQALRAAE